jgi:hypothetical protein
MPTTGRDEGATRSLAGGGKSDESGPTNGGSADRPAGSTLAQPAAPIASNISMARNRHKSPSSEGLTNDFRKYFAEPVVVKHVFGADRGYRFSE